jgi:hypothetical protein
MLRYLLIFAALPLFAQDLNPKMILRGYGAPAASRCAGLFAVGWEYKDLNPGGLNYNCTRSGAQAYAWVAVGSGGASVWGLITGTLSAQTDLQNALNAKDAVLSFSAPLSRSTNAISCPTCIINSGSYADPAWITSIAGSKVSGNIAGAAAALAANGANCASGEYARGVDASGNAEGCTVAATGGSLSIENDGSAVGTEATLNFVPGTGITNAITDVGVKINIQSAVDTAVIQSRANAQSGATLICNSAGGSTSAYTCAMSPTLTAYTTGMVVVWKPDVSSAAGAITLNVDILGAKGIKQADGTTDPGASGAVAGRFYPLTYDGTVFRLPASGSATLPTLSLVWCPLNNCTRNRETRLVPTANRVYFWRIWPERTQTVLRLAVPLFPWTNSDSLAFGLYDATGATKLAECNTETTPINPSSGMPVCTLSAPITLVMDTEYMLVIASETADPDLNCAGFDQAYELTQLFNAQPTFFPGSRAPAGYGANVASGSGASLVLPATIGAETASTECRPQVFTWPQ